MISLVEIYYQERNFADSGENKKSYTIFQYNLPQICW